MKQLTDVIAKKNCPAFRFLRFTTFEFHRVKMLQGFLISLLLLETRVITFNIRCAYLLRRRNLLQLQHFIHLWWYESSSA